MSDALGTKSGAELRERAANMASSIFRDAVQDIDERLGKDYAAEHPELVGAYMQVAATDYGASVVAQELVHLAEAWEGIGWGLGDRTDGDAEAEASEAEASEVARRGCLLAARRIGYVSRDEV